ncbi:sialate O-acetylesterase [Dyadobacter sp. CY261]|uniref:sialate O-acetylesterase n=1 Tax=Dyadobacter sp. CY261 TaxID=2907203 RepID=UPI001F3C017F|nr:sialate O-acetylesterase [Dyadobacter sp. CY261]MCF0068873.1 sialate O-acetylesterase [Dyadobacter sp. CY261]
MSLSYPINNSVLQRGTSNNAVITFAGQLVHNTLAVILSYRIRSVSATGVASAPGPATNLSMAANGMFYVTQVISKGWYLCEILFNGVVYASAKFGVGDVFIIAGQSNAQGVEKLNYLLPSGAGIPEWVVGTSEDKTCTKTFPASFTSMFSLNTPDEAKRHGKLGPSGNGIWAYATLGKLISDANGGMPVAFFNAATGGSSITEWKQGVDGVEAKHPYTEAQVCLGYQGGSVIPSDYYGLPYTTLKNALNYYGSLFGVRAVLWHQGEADADLNVSPIYKATSAADYQAKLLAVITKSRTDFGSPNLTWYVSKASISKFGPFNATIRTGQGNVATGSPNLSGPDTDYVNGSAGAKTDIVGADRYRVDTTHFYEGPGSIKGLTWLANKWFPTIGSLANPVAASWVPQLTYSKNADWRTLTVFGNAVQYSWSNIGINSPPVPGGNGNSLTTQDKYLGIRCYMKDATGNWHISQALNVGKYDNQREGAGVLEEKENEQPGFELNAYPNPYTTNFTITFDVPNENSYVKLDIINCQGNVLKTVVDNPHAKGKWQYEIKELPDSVNEILYCRLKINENYTVRKLLHLSK